VRSLHVGTSLSRTFFPANARCHACMAKTFYDFFGDALERNDFYEEVTFKGALHQLAGHIPLHPHVSGRSACPLYSMYTRWSFHARDPHIPAPFTELPFDAHIHVDPLHPGRTTLDSVGSLEFTAKFGRPLSVRSNIALLTS